MSTRALTTCLAGVIVSLLLVGLVSGTLLRHLIQVIPAAVAGVAVTLGTTWGRYAALSLFAFWFSIMVLVWFYLLGIAKTFDGYFTSAEIVLTIVIGACCGGGAFASFRGNHTASRSMRTLAFLGALALQVAAMWLSFQPQFAHD